MGEVFDYGIIGGGPAGYTLGMMYAKQGKSVVLFEKDKLGGTCLNRGCIPTKAFLHLAQVYSEVKRCSDYGICVQNPELDFSKIVEKKNSIVERVRKSLELAVKNSKVNVIYGEACIGDKNTILANGTEYSVKEIVIATGSKPKELKGLEFDHEFILNSDDILEITELPKSVLIVGSGAIGIEWARILSSFGCEVSIVELADHLIPLADIEVSKRIERIAKKDGIKLYIKDCVEKIEGKTVTLRSGNVITPEKILVAVGRTPVCPACDGADVLGDACGEIQLAHYAIQQAKAKVSGIPFDKNLVPSVIYGEPEIAWVGLREQECDVSYKKSMLPITALGKSWCDDATEGFIKIISKDNKIYGAHIVSKEASALIHTILVAMRNNVSIEDLKQVCFAHPTYSEGICEVLG